MELDRRGRGEDDRLNYQRAWCARWWRRMACAARALSGLSLGSAGGTAFSAKGGALVTLSRNVIRDSATAIRLDGAATNVSIINNTIVRNTDGVSAINNASFSVRNNSFSNNTGTALGFQSAAATQVHEYNNYFGNGAELRINGAAQPATGAGEIVQDPNLQQRGGQRLSVAQRQRPDQRGQPQRCHPRRNGWARGHRLCREWLDRRLRQPKL